MLYRATYYTARNPVDGSHQFETRILPTMRAVELWATDKLKGEHITCTRDTYHRDVGRAPSVTYKSIKTKTATHWDGEPYQEPLKYGEILPPITLVPSVGELGYW